MTDRKLRSNFTPGTTPWAMRRAQWSALGLTDEDLEKPKIAIVNSSSQLASCFSHLDEIVGPLKAAIEVAVEGALLDGMVCLASCDKTTPGQLMAAGRLNIPTIIVGCGYQPSGVYQGESVDFEDIFRFAGHGDMISIDVGGRTIDLEVDPAELGRRRADLPPLTAPGACGWLSVSARTVAPLGRGATLSGIAHSKS